MKDSKQFRAVIHLSSTAVQTVVGYFNESNKALKIVAVGVAPTDAFFAGKINDRAKLLKAIEDSTQQAMDMARLQLYDVGLSFATAQMYGISDYSWKRLIRADADSDNKQERIIQSQDILSIFDKVDQAFADRQYATVQMQNHIMVLNANTNQQRAVKNPVGLFANSLGVFYHVIAVPSGYYKQMKDLFKAKEFGIYPPMFAGVAGAEYALTEEEKQVGTCFVDIGVGITNVCLYKSGFLVFSCCIEKGGRDLTNKIAHRLNISYKEAESIKRRFGNADSSSQSRAKFINLCKTDNSGKELSFYAFGLAELIEEFYLELFDEVHQRILSSKLDIATKQGVVFAGGGSKIPGLDAIVRKQYGIPSRQMTLNKSVTPCERFLSEDEHFFAVKKHIESNQLYNAIGALLYQHSEQNLYDEELRYPNNTAPKNGWFGRLLDWKNRITGIQGWM